MSHQSIMEYIDPKKLHPDVNQPRQLDWESDEVKAELQKLADSYHGDPENQIWQIKIDENNTVRLGERRWRGALLANLPVMKVERLTGLSQLEWFRMQMEDDEYKVLHSELDKAWAYGLQVIRITSGDDSISLSDIKAMDHVELVPGLAQTLGKKKANSKIQQKGGVSYLGREIQKEPKSISDYISVLYLEPETRAMIGRASGKIPYTYARYLRRLWPDNLKEMRIIESHLRDRVFEHKRSLLSVLCDSINRLSSGDIKHDTMIDQIIGLVKSGNITSDEKLEAYVDEYLENHKKLVEERAKEIEAEKPEPIIEPSVEESEPYPTPPPIIPSKPEPSPDEPEPEKPTPKAEEPPAPPEPEPEVVETEAERHVRQTNEARDSALKILYFEKGKGNSLEGKITSAEKEEVSEEYLSPLREKFQEFDSSIKDGPLSKDDYENKIILIKDVIKGVTAVRKERKAEIDRQKLEDDEKERIREEVENDLREDEDFIDRVGEEMRNKQLAEFSKVVGELPEEETISPEELEDFEQSKKEFFDSVAKVLSSEVVRKRGVKFRNWWNHASVLGVITSLTCPECGSPSGNLVWSCHDSKLSFKDAIEVARKKYEETRGEEDWLEKDP